MSETSLREFADEIRQLIDEGRANEAIPRAQLLLRRFPRYVLGYRLLAEAAIRQGYSKDAIEIFRRVLSVDPESFPAHAGMANAYADEGESGEAIWYMMRAFEREPRMKEVRQQLRYYYEMRDGHAPGRLHLNRAALARMYMREGLYDRAVDELREEIQAEPDRVDLLVALAEAEWFANRRQEAVQTAQKILLELPYSLKANLLLTQFYAEEGDYASAAHFARIPQQLDPENDVALGLFGDGSYLRPLRVPFGTQEEEPSAPLTDEQRLPEWLADLTLFSSVEPEQEGMDWHAIIAYETDWRTLLASATRDEVAAFIPDWRVELRRATRVSLRERGEEVARPTRRPTTPTPVPVPAAPVMPVWEQALVEATRAAMPTPRAIAPEPQTSPWLGSLHAATKLAVAAYQPPREPAPPTLPADEWTHALGAATRTALAEEPASDAAPTWVEGLRQASDALEATPVTPEILKAPAWVTLLREESTPLLAPVEEPVARTERIGTGTLRLGIRWREQLRVETELALAAARREGLIAEAAILPEEEPEGATEVIEWAQELAETLKSQAGEVLAGVAHHEQTELSWVDPLREATLASLAARPVEPPTLTERLVERAQTVVESVRHKAADLLHRQTAIGEQGTEGWVATLNTDTRSQLATLGDNGHPTLRERLRDGASGLIERAQDVVGGLAERAPEPLASLLASSNSEGEDELADEADAFWSTVTEDEVLGRTESQTAPSAEADTAPVESPTPFAIEEMSPEEESAVTTPTIEEELALARAAWEAGQTKEAFAIYQRLFFESEERDDLLSASLAAWTVAGSAPSLAYQLLGDLYRRMGRMQDAIAQYREAINHM